VDVANANPTMLRWIAKELAKRAEALRKRFSGKDKPDAKDDAETLPEAAEDAEPLFLGQYRYLVRHERPSRATRRQAARDTRLEWKRERKKRERALRRVAA
jgi:hypothetical protein